MDNQTKKIFTIPLLMQRWNLDACEVLRKICTDRRNVYIHLAGETICTGFYSAGDFEDILKVLHDRHLHRPELDQPPRQYICEIYEELQLWQLKRMLNDFDNDQDFIEVKILEEIPLGEKKNVVIYRSLLNPVRISISQMFCFAEEISRYELSRNIPIETPNFPVSFNEVININSTNIPITNPKKSSSTTRKTERRKKFDKFVNFLIDNGYGYKTFKDEITTTYLSGKDGLKDDEKFNLHDDVTHLYSVENKNGTFTLHFSFVNSAGEPLPQEPYPLGTIKNIFSDVMQARRAAQNIR